MHPSQNLRLLFAFTVLPALALAQTTTRATVSSTGALASSGSAEPSLSADGRFVCFRSSATNLVVGDTNGQPDIFVHDRQTGQTTCISVSSVGAQSNGSSLNPDISPDGRFVVFESTASNLVAGDSNGTFDVFCHDRQTAQTTRVSVGTGGLQALASCRQGSISADGRYVAFESDDNNLVPGNTCLGKDVFLHDRTLGTTTLVSVSNTTGQTFTSRQNPRIADDGNFVVFDSAATDLISTDFNGHNDVFVWSRLTGGITLVSENGNQGNGASLEADLSADGRYVVFTSRATNFGSGTTNGATDDVFVRDRTTGQLACVSVATGGAGNPGFAAGGSISSDGRYVAFWSDATTLVAGDTNASYDCFRHDRQTGTTIRVSLSSSGLQARGQSNEPAIAGNGAQVAFAGAAANVVLPDLPNIGDVFVRDLTATAVALAYGTPCLGASPIPPQAEGIGQPFLGNANFAVGVCNGFPSALSVLAVATAPASIPVGACDVLLGGPLALSSGSFTDIFGSASAPLPIPMSPGLAGISVYGQYLVFDPNGQFLGFAQLSQGLAITLN